MIFYSCLVFIAEVIKGDGKNIPHIVKLWVEDYEKNPKPAMVELLTMLFEVILNALIVLCIEIEIDAKLLK